MKANTIKLESELLSEINSIRPPKMSLAAFVRELIGKEVMRRKLILAAEEYAEFLNSHPSIQKEDEEWESTALD